MTTKPAYTICLCPDGKLLQNRLHALAGAHPPAAGASQGNWQRHVFWGDEGLPPAFWEHLTLHGLFPTPKLIVVRNLQNIPADPLKRLLSPALVSLAASPSPLVWPVLCLEVPFEQGKPKVPRHITDLPCYALAEKNKALDIVPGLGPQNMAVFIRTEASSKGLNLKPNELAALQAALPPDAAHIEAELAKLALTADASGALPADALHGLSKASELGIFELLRNIQQNGDKPAVWRQVLEDRLGGETSVFGFTAIVLREARILWQIRAGTPPALPSFILTPKKAIADMLGFPGIAKLWDLALAAEKGIKTGERSPEQAFEMLTGELFLLFGGRR